MDEDVAPHDVVDLAGQVVAGAQSHRAFSCWAVHGFANRASFNRSLSVNEYEKHYFFSSVLLAIGERRSLCSASPFQGARVDLAAGPEPVHVATLALMRTFVMSFDVSMVAMWLPCALLLSRLKAS